MGLVPFEALLGLQRHIFFIHCHVHAIDTRKHRPKQQILQTHHHLPPRRGDPQLRPNRLLQRKCWIKPIVWPCVAMPAERLRALDNGALRRPAEVATENRGNVARLDFDNRRYAAHIGHAAKCEVRYIGHESVLVECGFFMAVFSAVPDGLADRFGQDFEIHPKLSGSADHCVE